MGRNSMLEKVTKIAAKITGRRYCSHHGGEVAEDAGSVVERNRSRRWICNACQEKSRNRNAEIRAVKTSSPRQRA